MGEKALSSKIHKKYVEKRKPAKPSTGQINVSGSSSSSETGLGTSISESEAFNSPDLRYRCGCKPGCNMHQFCDAGCPNPNKHDVVPVLSKSTSVATSLHHFHLEAQRGHEMRQMTATFASFVDETCKSIKKKVTVEEFALWLMQLQAFYRVSHSSESAPLLLAQQIDEICQASSMERVFLILSNYWSWYNHGLLEEIINKFGDQEDRTRLDDFKESFSTFAQNRIVEFSQHPMTFGAAVGDGQTRVPLLFKVDRNWDTVHINQLSEIHRNLASILGVNPHTLYLASIRKGCILMKFLIPSSVAKAVFPLSALQQQALATADVMLVKCGTHRHRFLPHSKNNAFGGSPHNDAVTTSMRTQYWSDVATPPESALDSDCDEGPSGDLTSDDDNAADSSSEQLSSDDSSSDSEEEGSEEVRQQIPRKIKKIPPVGRPRGILTTLVQKMFMFALVALCLSLLAGLRKYTPEFNHNWQSIRRGAGSDSLNLQCSKNGTIVQNPNFWVNITNVTLCSMPNAPVLPASMRYVDYSANTIQCSPTAPPLIPTPLSSQPTSTGDLTPLPLRENQTLAAVAMSPLREERSRWVHKPKHGKVKIPNFLDNSTNVSLRSMLNVLVVKYEYRRDGRELQFSMQPQLEGYYNCSDNIHSRRISNNVTLLAYPTDTNLETDYAVEAEETIRLPCGFEPGALAHHYRVHWSNRTVALDTTNPGPRLSIDLSDFTLTIKNAQRSDEGDYRCRVEVQVPPGNSFQESGSTLSLRVYTRPEIVMIDPRERVENVVDRSEKNASFRCTAIGKPRPQTVQWRHNNRDISELGDARYTYSTIISTSDSMTSELTIQRVKPTDSGTVHCVARSTVALPGEEEKTFQTTGMANLAILSDDIELQVTITTEETVQLRLTYSSLSAIPTQVRVLVRFIDTVEFRKEDKVVNGEITNSGDILYEEDRAPYQRFKVQVALVVGDVTGPMFPQSLEDARVYDLTEPSGEDSSNTLIIGISIGASAAVLIAVVMAGTFIYLRCRRQRIKRKHNKIREEEAGEHYRKADEAEKAGNLASRDSHIKRAEELLNQRVVPDNAGEESDETSDASYTPADSV